MIEHIVIEIHDISVSAEVPEIEIISDAPIGPRGNPGPTGPPGPGAETYVHGQIVPSAIWTITHNLGRYPAITVVDSSGRVVEGDISYLSTDELELEFSGAFAGTAYLN